MQFSVEYGLKVNLQRRVPTAQGNRENYPKIVPVRELRNFAKIHEKHRIVFAQVVNFLILKILQHIPQNFPIFLRKPIVFAPSVLPMKLLQSTEIVIGKVRQGKHKEFENRIWM